MVTLTGLGKGWRPPSADPTPIRREDRRPLAPDERYDGPIIRRRCPECGAYLVRGRCPVEHIRY
jgi:hypothetical protein